MRIQTPNFQGTHLWDRLCWAKKNLKPYKSEYCIVWNDFKKLNDDITVTYPDPNFLSCALQGGILPPIQVYWQLKKDEENSNFVNHTRGYLLHNTKPIEAMTEQQAIEYLIMKDLPEYVWKDYNKANKTRLLICKKSQLPSTKIWRNAWRINQELTTHNKRVA